TKSIQSGIARGGDEQCADCERSKIEHPYSGFDEVLGREGRVEWISQDGSYPGENAADRGRTRQPIVQPGQNVIGGQPDSILVASGEKISQSEFERIA